jgi:hypothetical protein
MADTRVQLEVEDWVRVNWMPNHFGQKFYRNRLRLSAGGVFDFDAVSEDQSIVASISTSAMKTSGGKAASGKLMKLRSDMLFLLMAETVSKRFIVLTEHSMFVVCQKERESGRAPLGIDFLLAKIPDELEHRLIQARIAASKEVSPRAAEQLPDEVLLQQDSKDIDN